VGVSGTTVHVGEGVHVGVGVTVRVEVGVPVGTRVYVEVNVVVCVGVGVKVKTEKLGETGTEIFLVQPTNRTAPAKRIPTKPTVQRCKEFMNAPKKRFSNPLLTARYGSRGTL
jgi:hypothetical protein